MKITYYGTAAAEGIPAIFCTCETCEKARKNGGKDIRTRSQSMIDENLLIDLPADTYMHVLHGGLPLHRIEHCIITHSHEDHLYPAELELLAGGFAPVRPTDKPFAIYGSRAVLKHISAIMYEYNLKESGRASFDMIYPFNTYSIGEYQVTPLVATHDTLSGPYIYIIEKDNERILYGNDTGLFPEETWEYLERNPMVFDFISLDCTAGIGDMDYDSHMNLERNIITKNRLTQIGCVNDDTVFCINHFSHNGGHILHKELSEGAKKHGFVVSYDGMVYDITKKKIVK